MTADRQMGKCKLWFKGASKRFVEIVYSIEGVKLEVFFASLNQWSLLKSTFESSLLKVFSLTLWSLLNSVSRSFKKFWQWRK